MDIQTIVVYLIFAACVVYAVRGFVRSLKKKKGCGCGCGCPGCTKGSKLNGCTPMAKAPVRTIHTVNVQGVVPEKGETDKGMKPQA